MCITAKDFSDFPCTPRLSGVLIKEGMYKDYGTPLKVTDLGITVKSISKETKKRIRLSTVAAAWAAVVDISDSANELGEVLPGNLYGGAGDADGGLGFVPALDNSKVGNAGECEEEEDGELGGERPSLPIQS